MGNGFIPLVNLSLRFSQIAQTGEVRIPLSCLQQVSGPRSRAAYWRYAGKTATRLRGSGNLSASCLRGWSEPAAARIPPGYHLRLCSEGDVSTMNTRFQIGQVQPGQMKARLNFDCPLRMRAIMSKEPADAARVGPSQTRPRVEPKTFTGRRRRRA